MLEVTLASKSDERGGGASRVCGQLLRLLGSVPHVKVEAWDASGVTAPPRRDLRGRGMENVLYRGGRLVSRKLGIPDFLMPDALSMHRRRHLRGIVHVHDISDALSPLSLRYWSRRAPLIWSLHDCSPFTGGCVYPLDCDHFRQGHCGNCPQLARWPLETSIDRTHFMQRYKLRLIDECVHSVVCPSKWIANEAISAGVREEKIRYIPNAVETEIFHPREKAGARHLLDLPQDARIVLLTSMDFDNPYKGMSLAMDALGRQSEPLYLLLIGANSHRPEMPPNVTPIFVEQLFDRELQAQYYSCADTLLFPSLEDNCPLTLLEAMACGLPPVAFDSGGIKELVDHCVEGWLARRGDVDGLAQGLRTALSNPELLRNWSDNARSRILRFHTEKMFLDRHLELYSECAKVGVLT